MKFTFRDQRGGLVGSTEFSKQILASAVETAHPDFAREIMAETKWRKNYQKYFVKLSEIEFGDRAIALDVMQSALAAMTEQIQNENNESIAGLARAGFIAKGLVETIAISGSGVVEAMWPSANLVELATEWVDRDLAEPDVLDAFKFLLRNADTKPGGDLLFALAGNAELSGAKVWLSLGGRVAVVARPNAVAWQELIEHAKNSAGTLLVPVLPANSAKPELSQRAGLDLVQDIAAIASWLHELSRTDARLVISSNAYIGGSQQIIAQAAQDALIAVATANITKSKLALSWLATPLDVVVAGQEIQKRQFEKHRARGWLARVRDQFWRVFAQLEKPDTKIIATTFGPAALFDASSVRQGSSYLLAKHSEKWRAMVAARQGNLVSYTVAPPAATRSVLGVKILNYTYKGLARFGVYPFSAAATRRVMSLLLLRNLNDSDSPAAPANSANQVRLVSATSVHGGTWHLAYNPDSIWVVATVLGFFSRRKKNAVVEINSQHDKLTE